MKTHLIFLKKEVGQSHQVIKTMVAIFLLVFSVSPAAAVIDVDVAQVIDGVAVVEGTTGEPHKTQIFWEGLPVTTAGVKGQINFSWVIPADCVGELSDGVSTIDVELDPCEPLPPAGAVFPGDGVDGPPLAYTDNFNGTFTDDNTGLMWEMKVAGGDLFTCDLTDLHLVNSRCTWDQFTGVWIDAINAEELGGFTDWRPANVKELQSIVDYSTLSPASSVPGATAASLYWSSTAVAFFPENAWYVDFYFGVVFGANKSDFFHVRAVRGGR